MWVYETKKENGEVRKKIVWKELNVGSIDGENSKVNELPLTYTPATKGKGKGKGKKKG